MAMVNWRPSTKEEQCFEQMILANPDDDAPRLVFADYLDEHNQSAKAQFLRAEVELRHLAHGDNKRKDALYAILRKVSKNHIHTNWLMNFGKKYDVVLHAVDEHSILAVSINLARCNYLGRYAAMNIIRSRLPYVIQQAVPFYWATRISKIIRRRVNRVATDKLIVVIEFRMRQ